MKKLSLVFAFILTFSSGMLDVYTYASRGEVFATMQTGNMLKFAVAVFEDGRVLKFILPILSFIVGIFVARAFSLTENGRAYCLSVQAVLTASVVFIPFSYEYNVFANCLLSIVGAMIFESFRVCCGTHYTATMCTNDLRLFAEGFFDAIFKRSKKKTLFYLFIILCFTAGCVAGKALVDAIFNYTVLALAAFYVILFVINIFIGKETCDIKQS